MHIFIYIGVFGRRVSQRRLLIKVKKSFFKKNEQQMKIKKHKSKNKPEPQTKHNKSEHRTK